MTADRSADRALDLLVCRDEPRARALARELGEPILTGVEYARIRSRQACLKCPISLSYIAESGIFFRSDPLMAGLRNSVEAANVVTPRLETLSQS